MPVPVVIYAAKSTQDKHRSIATQLEDGRTKAAEEDWEVVGEFFDEKFSAYSGNRGRGLREAKDLAVRVAEERGTICMLVAQASDRFARGEGDKPGAADALIEIWHLLRRLNVHLRSVEDDGDLRDSPSVANLGHRAMMESKRKSGAVKKGMARRAKKGLPIGSRDALGLRINADGYAPIPDQVPTVERIFRELRAGRSQLAITRDLSRDGVPTATGEGKWHQGTVHRIARNPIYKGMVIHRGEVRPGQHEAIIKPELWDEVNAILDSRATQLSGKSRGRPSLGSHLFRKGMLRCVCGETMLPRTNRKKAKDGSEYLYEVYICSGRNLDLESCAMLPIKRPILDLSVYRYFEQVGLDIEATRDQLIGARDARLTESCALLEQAKSEEQRAEESLTRIRRDYTRDKITAEDWSEFKEDLTQELNGARAQFSRFARQVREIEAWGGIQDAERDVLMKLTEIRQAMVGDIKNAEGVEAVRAALLRLFEGFRLRKPIAGESVHVDLLQRGGGLMIDPIPQEQGIEGYSTGMLPIFRREPLYSAENNYAASLLAE
jgi:DNA invertase Pin-like site-specific DNA recombinase